MVDDFGTVHVGLEVGGGPCDVMGIVILGVVLSRQPQNQPGVAQWWDATVVDEVGSRQPPNQPQ